MKKVVNTMLVVFFTINLFGNYPIKKEEKSACKDAIGRVKANK